MRRLVVIVSAPQSRPALLLADEPKGNLDSKISLEVMTLLQELNREGVTVMSVTHEIDIAAYASRRLVIKDGRPRADERHPPKSAAADLGAWTEEL